MPPWTRALPVLRSLLLAATIVAVPALASGTLTGVYTADLIAADFQNAPEGAPLDRMTGKWKITFKDDGTFTVEQNEAMHVTGKYSVNGDELTLTDIGGDFACRGAHSPDGVYRVERDATNLRLTLVRDAECEGRSGVLTAKPFTAAK